MRNLGAMAARAVHVPMAAPWVQAAVGGLALVLGGLVYALDRGGWPLTQLAGFAGLTGLAGATAAPWFGSVGGWLPSLVHPLPSACSRRRCAPRAHRRRPWPALRGGWSTSCSSWASTRGSAPCWPRTWSRPLARRGRSRAGGLLRSRPLRPRRPGRCRGGRSGGRGLAARGLVEEGST